MQGKPPWFTPPSSALQSETNSNYFYGYNQQWNSRPPDTYDPQFYASQTSYSMTTMRTCDENIGANSNSSNVFQSNYECSHMFFRQGASTSFGGNGSATNSGRCRNERTKSSNFNAEGCQMNNFDNRSRNVKSNAASAAKADTESENFSSVFTQSLTSLYSQDADGNFGDDKNCDPEITIINCPRLKTEEGVIPNPSSGEYSFSPLFDVRDNTPSIPNFENVKIKTERFSPDPTYENYAMDDMYLRRRGTLAEAYSRKRKHSVPAMYGATSMNGIGNENKACRMYQPDTQWIPNSLQNCRADEQMQTCAYQQNDFGSGYDTPNFGNSNFKKRNPVKSRTTRRKCGESTESKAPSVSKKVQKKISPLTVYVKILDDVIMDVTCRRYKKRTKPAEDTARTRNHNQRSDAYESWKDVYQIVGEVLRNVVDKVSQTIALAEKPTVDLTTIPPARGSELLFKFCHDYSLDYKDFANFYEIIGSDVTSNKEEGTEKRRSRRDKEKFLEREEPPTRLKRRRTAYNDESVCRRSERGLYKEPRYNKKEKPVEKNEQPEEPPKPTRNPVKGRNSKRSAHPPPELPTSCRVLRNLPSRQPQKTQKKLVAAPKKGGSVSKSRYPKRNLRSKNPSVNLGKKLKILIDLSNETDQPEILVDSDSSRTNSNFDNAKDEEIEVETRGPITYVESDADSNATKLVVVESEDATMQDTIDLEESLAVDDERSADLTKDTSPIAVPAEGVEISKVKKEGRENTSEKRDDEEEVNLRQPPQLVRMTDNLFSEEGQETSMMLPKEDTTENISPGFLESQGLSSDTESAPPPPTLRLGASYSRSPSRASNCSDVLCSELEEDVDKLVIDTASKDENDNDDNDDDEDDDDDDDDDDDEYDAPSSKNGESKTKGSEDKEPKSWETGKKNGDFLNDDSYGCVVYRYDGDKASKSSSKDSSTSAGGMSDSAATPPKVTITLKNDDCSPYETLSEDEKSVSSGSKNSSMDEPDESILRTLLLESEAASNSSFGRDLEFSTTSCPMIAKVMSLARRESSLTFNALKRQPPTPVADTPVDTGESLGFTRCQSYDTYFRSMSPDAFQAAQRRFEGSPSPPLTQMATCQVRFTLREQQQLKARIDKLNKEIMYLEVMAEQKRREKTAIVCYKRYKEMLLRRVYKVYDVAVRNNVRNSAVSNAESSAENLSTDNVVSSNDISSLNNRSELPCLSNQLKTIAENLRAENGPKPVPAHSSSSHQQPALRTPKALARPRTNTSPTEKSPAVAANSSENCGLDMTNLRDRLQSSPASGTILQKVLSSKSSSRNSTPDQYGQSPWSPDMSSKRSNPTAKPVPKQYPDQFNIPLDMVLPQTSSLSPSTDTRVPKVPERYRGGQDHPRSSHTPNDRSQMQSPLPDQMQRKAPANSYRSWSIQTGGRISNGKAAYTKPSATACQPTNIMPLANATAVESPLQRQLNSHKAIPRPSYGLPSAAGKPPSFEPRNHRPNIQNRTVRPPLARGSRARKPVEERRLIPYGSISTLSSNGTVPYGGHIIPNINLLSPASISKCGLFDDNSPPPPCMGCGLTYSKFLCSGCRNHWYCSPRCQSMRWPEHSSMCIRMCPDESCEFS